MSFTPTPPQISYRLSTCKGKPLITRRTQREEGHYGNNTAIYKELTALEDKKWIYMNEIYKYALCTWFSKLPDASC